MVSSKLIQGNPDQVPKSDDVLDETMDAGKIKIREENDLAFEELILSIKDSTKKGRVAFQLVKGCKTRNHKDSLASLAWQRLEAKYATKECTDINQAD